MRKIGRQNTTLAGFATDIDLQADIQRSQLIGPLLTQSLSNLKPVHAMYPVEAFSEDSGFVGLDRADEVPDDVQICQILLLRQGFLKIVFTEITLPQLIGKPKFIGGSGFAYSYQLH
jgi:hypothetical protein